MEIKRSVWLPYIQVTGAMVIVGSTLIVGKLISTSLPLFLAASLRFALASLFFLVLVLSKEKRFPRISRRELGKIMLISFVGNFLYSIFLLYGLMFTGAAESGIISGTAPVVTALLSFLLLRERLGGRKLMGLLLVIAGMVTMNLDGSGFAGNSHTLLGDLLIGGSVLGEALWTIIGKTVSPRLSPLVVAAMTTFFGFLFFFPFGLFQSLTFPLSSLSPADWLVIAYYGTIGTVGAYLLWYTGIARLPASTAGMFVSIIPVSAVLLSVLILKETISWTQGLGMCCVLAALLCLTIKKKGRLSSPTSVPQTISHEEQPRSLPTSVP